MGENRTIYPHPVIGERIERLWHDTGLSAERFMRKGCNMERKSLYAWINGVSSPNSTSLKYICEEYHVSADWILGLKEKPDV